MTEIIYATQRVANAGDRQIRNPVHFVTPDEDAKTVYVQEGFDNVRAAYSRKKGVTVKDLSDLSNASTSQPSPAAKKS